MEPDRLSHNKIIITSKIYKPFLVSIAYLTLGLLIITGVGQMKLGRTGTSIVILFAFLLLNLTVSHFFHLKNDLQKFWSLKKLWLLPIGIVAGGLLAILPLLFGIFMTNTSWTDITFIQDVATFSSIAATLIIVSWEELWFRGVFVNYCNRYLSATILSLSIGLLFVLVHFLNPRIDLTRSGPALFFAGALLTIVYIYFRTIWVPIGLHFGNNVMNTMWHSNLDSDKWFGNDGYLSAIILALLFFIFVQLNHQTKSTKQSNHSH